MKLSELLAKPFKLKGGAILNLKGFSKRVKDEEVGEGGETNKNIITTLSTILGIPVINQEFVVDSNNNLIKINELPATTKAYYTLIEKSDYEILDDNAYILYQLTTTEKYFNLSTFNRKSQLIIKNEFNIDGEIYCTLESGAA